MTTGRIEMTVTAKQILERTKTLLTPKGSWTKGENAKDARGYRTVVTDPETVCWCLLGGILKAAADLEGTPFVPTSDAMVKAKRLVNANLPSGYINIPDWNDDFKRTHEDVLKILDISIEQARGKAPRGYPL